jgi:hypothetical protein
MIILVIAYHVLFRKQPYADLGANAFSRLEKQLLRRRRP